MFLQAHIRFLRVVIRKLGGEKKYLLILILPKNIRVLQINTSNLLLVISIIHSVGLSGSGSETATNIEVTGKVKY